MAWTDSGALSHMIHDLRSMMERLEIAVARKQTVQTTNRQRKPMKAKETREKRAKKIHKSPQKSKWSLDNFVLVDDQTSEPSTSDHQDSESDSPAQTPAKQFTFPAPIIAAASTSKGPSSDAPATITPAFSKPSLASPETSLDQPDLPKRTKRPPEHQSSRSKIHKQPKSISLNHIRDLLRLNPEQVDLLRSARSRNPSAVSSIESAAKLLFAASDNYKHLSHLMMDQSGGHPEKPQLKPTHHHHQNRHSSTRKWFGELVQISQNSEDSSGRDIGISWSTNQEESGSASADDDADDPESETPSTSKDPEPGNQNQTKPTSTSFKILTESTTTRTQSPREIQQREHLAKLESAFERIRRIIDSQPESQPENYFAQLKQKTAKFNAISALLSSLRKEIKADRKRLAQSKCSKEVPGTLETSPEETSDNSKIHPATSDPKEPTPAESGPSSTETAGPSVQSSKPKEPTPAESGSSSTESPNQNPETAGPSGQSSSGPTPETSQPGTSTSANPQPNTIVEYIPVHLKTPESWNDPSLRKRTIESLRSLITQLKLPDESPLALEESIFVQSKSATHYDLLQAQAHVSLRAKELKQSSENHLVQSQADAESAYNTKLATYQKYLKPLRHMINWLELNPAKAAGHDMVKLQLLEQIISSKKQVSLDVLNKCEPSLKYFDMEPAARFWEENFQAEVEVPDEFKGASKDRLEKLMKVLSNNTLVSQQFKEKCAKALKCSESGDSMDTEPRENPVVVVEQPKESPESRIEKSENSKEPTEPKEEPPASPPEVILPASCVSTARQYIQNQIEPPPETTTTSESSESSESSETSSGSPENSETQESAEPSQPDPKTSEPSSVSETSEQHQKLAAHYAAIKTRFWYKCKLCQMPFEKAHALEVHLVKCSEAKKKLEKRARRLARKAKKKDKSSKSSKEPEEAPEVEILEPKKPKISPENPVEPSTEQLLEQVKQLSSKIRASQQAIVSLLTKLDNDKPEIIEIN